MPIRLFSIEFMKMIPTPNSFQFAGCEGACKEHQGEVRRVEVKCQGHPEGTWGVFRYCDEAIEEDKRRGLNPIILENAKADRS